MSRQILFSKNIFLKNYLQNLRKRKYSTEFPSKCDAVVIGGGSLGCSTLYHLTKHGMKNVVLLERNKLTSGTTWHTAGLVWSLRPSDTDIQLLETTRNMLARLEEETGIFPGWNNNGGLFLASTKERLDEYKRLHTIGKPFKIESQVLSPKETKDIFPLLDESTLYGTIFCKSDGNVDPSSLCNALTRYASNNGAKIYENCPVEEIYTKESTFGTKEITGIKTSLGKIETNIVINCTGAWAPSICDLVGIKIPLIPIKHSYVIFDRMEELKGLPNIRDHDEGIYLRTQSDTLFCGGYELNPIILDDVEKDFAFGLYELDWDIFGIHIKGALKRIPKLKDLGIKSTICGPESFTPDHKPIMGEDPNVNGFFHGCGFNSAGMMFGGGCGKELSNWVINGHPDLDMFSYDIRRFHPELLNNTVWAKEKSHEAYAKNYSIVYKNDESLSGRNCFLSPFHEALVSQGCVYQERQGWERPGYFSDKNISPVLNYDWYGQYGNPSIENYEYGKRLQEEYSFEFPNHHKIIENECLNCRNNAAVFDMSYFGKFFLTGPDAEKAAEWIFSNKMSRKPGTVVYTCILNKSAGIEADLTVTVLNEEQRLQVDPSFNGIAMYVAVGGTTSNYTYSIIKSELKNKKFDAELHNCNVNYGLLSVQGPQSRNILKELFKDESFSNESFPFSTHKILYSTLDNVPVRVMRVTFVGEMGWELHIPKENCMKIYQNLMEIGKKYNLKNSGYRAIDSLSIEKGYRHWHGDIRADDNPIEAGLTFTCKLKSDINFLGRKSLEEYKNSGKIKKRLFCFTVENGQVPLWGLETIWNDDKPVGYLRRAEYAFHIKKSLGYGYIKFQEDEQNMKAKDYLKGKQFFIESMGKKYPAKAQLKSPFDPENSRIQGIY